MFNNVPATKEAANIRMVPQRCDAFNDAKIMRAPFSELTCQ